MRIFVAGAGIWSSSISATLRHRRRCGEAEDIVQEAFLRYHRAESGRDLRRQLRPPV